MSKSLVDLKNENMPNPREGTNFYMAPEIRSKERVQDGTKSDVFALGCILFTMYFYAYPWQSINDSPHEHEIYYRHLCNNRPDLFWKAQVNRRDITGSILKIPDDFKYLVEWMLHPNPEKRPSIADILKHPWVLNLSNTKPED
jgi:serine/threonine protein kinase